MRDGMNLVAKEYVASQNPDDPGVLVLSRFAGAAQECKEALLVNPYDPDSVAAALGQALAMSLAERRERYNSLFRTLSHNNIVHWATGFLAKLERAPNPPSFEVMHPPNDGAAFCPPNTLLHADPLVETLNFFIGRQDIVDLVRNNIWSQGSQLQVSG